MMLEDLFNFSMWGDMGAATALPKLSANKNQSTTSGLSSGAYMAVQMHVAYSDVFKGVGVFAGGPYDCAQGKEMTAITACMSSPVMIKDNQLESVTDQYVSSSVIADTANLKDQPVYMFSGKMDYTVRQGVMDKLQSYYNHYGGDIEYEKTVVASHTMPTDLDRNKNACTVLASPFISNCAYDGAGEMFKKITPNQEKKPLKDRDLDWEKHGSLSEFDQTEFVSGSKASMDDTGYVFVPKGCEGGKNKCKVHVAFHGCKQGKIFVDDTYAKDSGYLEWAGVNNIITLFPQATKTSLSNPNGCWDWWGYAGADYTQRDGVQMKAVMDMIDRLHEAPSKGFGFPAFPAFGMETPAFPAFGMETPSFGFEDFASTFMMVATMLFKFFRF